MLKNNSKTTNNITKKKMQKKIIPAILLLRSFFVCHEWWWLYIFDVSNCHSWSRCFVKYSFWFVDFFYFYTKTNNNTRWFIRKTKTSHMVLKSCLLDDSTQMTYLILYKHSFLLFAFFLCLMHYSHVESHSFRIR